MPICRQPQADGFPGTSPFALAMLGLSRSEGGREQFEVAVDGITDRLEHVLGGRHLFQGRPSAFQEIACLPLDQGRGIRSGELDEQLKAEVQIGHDPRRPFVALPVACFIAEFSSRAPS